MLLTEIHWGFLAGIFKKYQLFFMYLTWGSLGRFDFSKGFVLSTFLWKISWRDLTGGIKNHRSPMKIFGFVKLVVYLNLIILSRYISRPPLNWTELSVKLTDYLNFTKQRQRSCFLVGASWLSCLISSCGVFQFFWKTRSSNTVKSTSPKENYADCIRFGNSW